MDIFIHLISSSFILKKLSQVGFIGIILLNTTLIRFSSLLEHLFHYLTPPKHGAYNIITITFETMHKRIHDIHIHLTHLSSYLYM